MTTQRAEMTAYTSACANRTQIIHRNASARLRGAPCAPVPVKPAPPMARIAYDPDGTYLGRVLDGHEPPEGAIVKQEIALW